MSRSKQKAAELATQHLFRTEQVVRLECERRESKARLKLLDTLTEELDDQLLYVAQFKKEWLEHRRDMEEARQMIVREEETHRAEVEEDYIANVNRIIRHYYPSVVAKAKRER